MPDKPIDELFIEISAEQTNANRTISAMAKSLDSLSGSLNKLSSLSTVAKDIKALVEPIEKSKGSTNSLAALASGLRALGKIDGIQNTVSNIRAVYNEISRFGDLPVGIQQTISSLGSLVSNAKTAKAALDGVGDNTEQVGTTATATQTAAPKVDNSKTIGDVIAKAQEAKAVFSNIFSNSFSQNFTQAFADIRTSVEGAKAKFSDFKTSIASNVSEGMATAKTKFKGLPAAANAAIKGVSFKNLGAAASVVFGTMSKPIAAVGKTIKKQLSERVADFKGKLKGISFKSLINGVKKFGNGVKNAFQKGGAFVKKMGSAFGGLVKKIVPGAEHLEKFNGVFKKLFSRIVTMGLLRRAFSAMIKAMQEGIGNVAKSVDSYNKSMSTMATAGNYVKNALAASLAPAIAAIAPIIDTIADKFVKLTEIIAQVMAKITGAKTFVKAKKTQVDYAKSLDSSASSADKAKKASEAYKKSLAGFDEINQLPSAKSDDSSSSGGSSSSSGGFEEVKVADTGIVGKIGKMIDDIKTELKNGDFYGAGKTLAEGLNKVIDYINNLDWDGVQNKVKKWASNIGSTINGFVENVDWSGIGVVLGNVLNTALNFVNTLEHSINWNAVGKAFADGINGLLSKLDPEQVGEKLTGELRLIILTVEGFVQNLNFANLGNFIGQSLISAVDNVPWDNLGSTLSSGISGIFDTITNIFTAKSDTTGNDLSTTLSNAVNKIFKSFDAKKIGASLTKSVNGIFTSLKSLFKSINWAEIGADVGDILNSIFYIDWGGVTQTLSEAVHGVFELLNGFITSTDWGALGKAVMDAIKGIDFKQILGDIGTTAKELINGALDLIIDLLDNLDIAELVNDIISGAADLLANLDIESVVHKLGEVVKSLFDALADIDWVSMIDNLVTAVWDVIVSIDWLSLINDLLYIIIAALEGVMNSWNNVFDAAATLIQQLLDGMAAGLSALHTWLTDHLYKPIGNWFSKNAEKFKKWGSGLVKKIKDGVGNIWDKIKTAFTNFFTKASTWFSDTKKKFKEWGSNLITKLRDGIGGIWGKIKEKFTDFSKSISSWISKKKEDFKNWGGKLIDGLKDGIGGIWGKIKENFETFIEKVKNFFGVGKDKKTDKFSSLGKNIITGIKDGIVKNWETIITTLSQKFTQVGDKVKEWLGIGGSKKSSSSTKTKGHAIGGIPKSGEMFYARENGIPEFVGKFGNKTGVANNQQIVSGISEGVYQAVVSALSSQRGTGGGEASINLNVDGRTLESVVYNENQKKLRRRSAFG